MQLSSSYSCIVVAAVAIVAAASSLAISLLTARSLSRRIRRIEALASALTSRAVRSFIKSANAKRRVRKRYLVVRVVGSVGRAELNNLLLNAVRTLYGSVASGVYGVRVVDFDQRSMTAIVRLRSDGRWAVLAAVGAVESVSKGSVALVPLRMCGTLRKAREYVRRLRC